MDRRKVILLVGALVVALCTAFLARSLFAGSAAPKVTAAAPLIAAPEGPKVLVAARALPVGTILTPDSVTYQPWPSELVDNAYFLQEESEIDQLLGTVVRAPVTAGQPVTKGSLVKPGERGFLAAALGPGMRAVTVPVSARTGVAGFVFPGDRVDVVLTQSVSGGEGPALKTSETIIRNLRVLATDQRVNAENEDGDPEVRTFSTVTVEATPKLAEKIAVAQTIGTLSLSLRSIADNEAELERAIAAGDIKLPKGADRKAEEQFLATVATRPIDTDTTYVTGGDVSRFQRRSVPVQTTQRSDASGASRSAVTGQAVSVGPVVRIARGNNVSEVPVGGK